MQIISLLLSALILLASCSSTTMIQSAPSGAKVYLNGESVGVTPYRHRDTKITGSTTHVKLEQEGYESYDTFFSRDEEVDVGAIVGGFFFMIPFLWTMKYKPTHTYELLPIKSTSSVATEKTQTESPLTPSESKVIKLRQLKALLDDKIITQEEFDKEKKKILEADDK
jgi:PEGA domain/Short C-terminal domain